MIRSRPIRFTDHLDDLRRLLDALGATVVTDLPGWVVYAVGSGRVALHQASTSDAEPGETRLAFETPDLATWAVAAAEAAAPFQVGDTDHGEAATVQAADGTRLTVDPVPDTGAAGRDSPLAVLPLWYTADPAPAREVLSAIGARQRIASRSGDWTDFDCELGGLVAVHREAHTEIELTFEYAGDVEALVPALAAAGFTPALVDEAYNRTLRVPDPDRDADIWINEQITDLYGFTAAH